MTRDDGLRTEPGASLIQDRLEARANALNQAIPAAVGDRRDSLAADRDLLFEAATRVGLLEAAICEIVDAGEALTRPGSAMEQHVNVARMTTAVQAGAKLVGHEGIFPELAS